MLQILDPPPADVVNVIAEGISRHNSRDSVLRENFAIVKRGTANRLIGGVTASVSFSILFINNIWVEEGDRLTGVGRTLLIAAEAEGKKRRVKTACVDTLSTQAPEFYEKLGYLEFGRVEGEVEGLRLDRIWFRKYL
jgi:N-acetylglutamate synthase-like GNAT family acetyltransferase